MPGENSLVQLNVSFGEKDLMDLKTQVPQMFPTASLSFDYTEHENFTS